MLVVFGLTVGLTTDVGDVVFVVGVVEVLFVTVGFVVVVFGVVELVKDVLGFKVVLGVEDVFVVIVDGLVNAEVNGRLPELPAEVIEDAPLSEI